jgi:hypothetical protein
MSATRVHSIVRRPMEIRQSQFNDPEVKSGQHTNGPANIFVREDDTCPWYVVTEPMGLAKAKRAIEQIGLDQFQKQYCARIAD